MRVSWVSAELLRHHFGSGGDHLWELSHGIDDRPVVPVQETKSISHETTFAKDLEDPEQLRAWLLELSEQVGCPDEVAPQNKPRQPIGRDLSICGNL